VGRTFAIGDIHGDRVALERLLGRLPFIAPDDTLLFIGDYVDRGPDSRGVIDRLRRLPEETAGKVVFLRGNHEDAWLRSWQEPDLGFLMPRSNGTGEMYRSFVPGRPLGTAGLPFDEIARLFDVRSWLPEYVVTWMATTVPWYEDEHAIYVHAGLDGEGTEWKHPRDGAERPLLWMREPDFFAQYEGKTVVFGHTPVQELPPAEPTRRTPWTRGPLIGLDTGAGRDGPLSCLELPSRALYASG
jgi:serine/threonine protein phosphatase 1